MYNLSLSDTRSSFVDPQSGLFDYSNIDTAASSILYFIGGNQFFVSMEESQSLKLDGSTEVTFTLSEDGYHVGANTTCELNLFIRWKSDNILVFTASLLITSFVVATILLSAIGQLFLTGNAVAMQFVEEH